VPEPGPERALAVVVPARNEQELLGRCLASVGASVAELARSHPTWRAVVLVVLDRCTDDSATIAEGAGVHTWETDVGSVGSARLEGVTRAAALLAPAEAERIWVANTDADSVVPLDWLSRQAEVAARGGELVVGRVRPHASDLSAALLTSWSQRHLDHTVGRHVHGANLGFALAPYLAVGGFVGQPVHEDRDLVAALVTAGAVPHPGAEVVTSGRRRGRAPAGFASFLADLESPTGRS
jgi:glycosyltransferase involved in cell wall biosynthesis